MQNLPNILLSIMASKLLLKFHLPDLDYCAKKPCKHGTCKDESNDFSCTCESGWEGKKCDIGMIVRSKNLNLVHLKNILPCSMISKFLYFSRHRQLCKTPLQTWNLPRWVEWFYMQMWIRMGRERMWHKYECSLLNHDFTWS